MNNLIKEEELHLALWNPRFEIIGNLEFDFLSQFKSADKNYDLYHEIEQMVLLYNDEKDAFEELLKSISKKLYSVNEKIQLIKKDDKYIVIEGNRRIACVKILANIEKYLSALYKYNELEKQKFNSSVAEKYILFYNFLKKIKETINWNSEQFVNLESKNFAVYDNNQDIFNSLFKKHTGGKNVGYSSWSKGKYYSDIYLIFLNENWYTLKDIDEAKVESLLNKSSKSLFEDYTEACFLIQQLKNNSNYSQEEVLKQLSKMKPSAFLTKFVRITLKNVLLAINPNLKIEEFYKLEFENQGRQWINKGQFQLTNVLSFINSLKEKGLQTTRFKYENIDEMKKLCSYHLNLHYQKLTKMDFINKFSTMSEFELISIKEKEVENENVEELINQRIYQFDLSKTLIKTLKSKQVDALFELTNQIIHNSKEEENSYFLNAIQSAVRTMCEYILKLILIKCFQTYHTYNLELKKEFKQSISCLREMKQSLEFNKEENKNKILRALLGSYNNQNINGFSTLFHNILSITQDNEFKYLKDLKETKVFKDNFYYFFKETYSINDFYSFLIENISKINVFIHKIYVKDFDTTTNLMCELLKTNNQILTDFVNIINSLENGKINKIVTEINRTANIDYNEILKWNK
ncbi:hypothetical protein [Mycoplasma buteonis]|uniref:hypothetical protein n=1 Tax=Mycoplasma buteonis TaxID=171280 RepID=UPI000560451D|nr:hypothetical protein [Mycoplasma buteonis]